MRGNYLLGGFLLMVLGGIIYKDGVDAGSIFSWAGLILIVAGLVMKRKPTELEELQIEELRRKLKKE